MTRFFTLTGVIASLVSTDLSGGRLRLHAIPSLPNRQSFVQTLDGEIIHLPAHEIPINSDGTVGSGGIQLLSPRSHDITPTDWGWRIRIASLDRPDMRWEVLIAPEPGAVVTLGHLIPSHVVQGMDNLQEFLLQLAAAYRGEKGDTGQGVVPGGTTGQALVKVSDADFDMGWGDLSAQIAQAEAAANAASGSASAAQSSASAAADSADDAEMARLSAEVLEQSATAAALAANTSKNAAAGSASAAASSAGTASTAASAAESSATAAAQSATASAGSATAAAQSATDAATTLAGTVRHDITQTLSAANQLRARSNIGLGTRSMGNDIVGAGRPDISATMDADTLAMVNAATSGMTFYSTDGPQGAWVWRKRGSTWVCVEGDTGAVDASALVVGGEFVPVNAMSRGLAIRRLPGLVWFAGKIKPKDGSILIGTATNFVAINALPLPAWAAHTSDGFVAQTTLGVANFAHAVSGVVGNWGASNQLSLRTVGTATWVAGGWIAYSATMHLPDSRPWPTTLTI